MPHLPASLLSALLLSAALLPAQALPWRVCLAEGPMPPAAPGRELDPAERLLIDAGRQAGLAIEFGYAPPARCLAALERCEFDAGLAIPSQRNQQSFQFPRQGTQVDSQRHLVRVRFLLLKRSDTPLSWDGRSFGLADGEALTLGTQNGYSAVLERAQQLSLRVDHGAKSLRQLLEMLQRGRFELAAAMDRELLRELQRPQALMVGMTVLEPPLLSHEIYAVTSQRAWQQHPARIQAWWDAIGRLREQPAYRTD